MKNTVKESGMIRMSRWRCYLMMMIHQAPWLGWGMGAVAAGLIAAGFIVSPWIGMAAIGFSGFLMVMAMSFVIMAYGFNSITGVNMAPHGFRIEGDKVVVCFEEGDPVEVDRKDLHPYSIYPGGILIPVAGARKGWLWLPPKAFETDEDFSGFTKALYA